MAKQKSTTLHSFHLMVIGIISIIALTISLVTNDSANKCFWEFMKVEKVDYINCGPNPLSCNLLVCGKISASWVNVDEGTYACYVFGEWDKVPKPGKVYAIRWCLVDTNKGIWRIRGMVNFVNS